MVAKKVAVLLKCNKASFSATSWFNLTWAFLFFSQKEIQTHFIGKWREMEIQNRFIGKGEKISRQVATLSEYGREPRAGIGVSVISLFYDMVRKGPFPLRIAVTWLAILSSETPDLVTVLLCCLDAHFWISFLWSLFWSRWYFWELYQSLIFMTELAKRIHVHVRILIWWENKKIYVHVWVCECRGACICSVN